MPKPSSLYCGYRFPATIISKCVWLYQRFNLSLRDVEELMARDGITVSYETIRQWSRKFGATFADGVRARHPPTEDKLRTASACGGKSR